MYPIHQPTNIPSHEYLLKQHDEKFMRHVLSRAVSSLKNGADKEPSSTKRNFSDEPNDFDSQYSAISDEESIIYATSLRHGCRKNFAPRIEKDEPKKVSFGRCEIRVHKLIIGNHPCCTHGLPLSLGWEHAKNTLVCDVDDFESKRNPTRRTNFAELKLTASARKQMLHKVSGYSRSFLDRMEESRHLHDSRLVDARTCVLN